MSSSARMNEFRTNSRTKSHLNLTFIDYYTSSLLFRCMTRFNVSRVKSGGPMLFTVASNFACRTRAYIFVARGRYRRDTRSTERKIRRTAIRNRVQFHFDISVLLPALSRNGSAGLRVYAPRVNLEESVSPGASKRGAKPFSHSRNITGWDNGGIAALRGCSTWRTIKLARNGPRPCSIDGLFLTRNKVTRGRKRGWWWCCAPEDGHVIISYACRIVRARPQCPPYMLRRNKQFRILITARFHYAFHSRPRGTSELSTFIIPCSLLNNIQKRIRWTVWILCRRNRRFFTIFIPRTKKGHNTATKGIYLWFRIKACADLHKCDIFNNNERYTYMYIYALCTCIFIQNYAVRY